MCYKYIRHYMCGFCPGRAFTQHLGDRKCEEVERGEEASCKAVETISCVRDEDPLPECSRCREAREAREASQVDGAGDGEGRAKGDGDEPNAEKIEGDEGQDGKAEGIKGQDDIKVMQHDNEVEKEKEGAGGM